MSSVTTELRAPAVARPRALRAADGVIAGYIHSLARAAAKSPAGATTKPKLTRLASRTYECGASRGNGLVARRRPPLMRATATA